MGQAKNRGSQLERINQAIKTKSDTRPDYLVCNECGEHIKEFEEMDTKGMHGITAAFAGTCACGRATFAVSGDKNATVNVLSALQEDYGLNSKIGHQQTGKLNDKKET